MPGEDVPRLGAVRGYFSHEEWKAKASEFMDRAALLVFIAGITDGLRWEYSEAVRKGYASKCAVLVPPNRVGNSSHVLSAFGVKCDELPAEDKTCVLGVVFNTSGTPKRIVSRSALSIAYSGALDIAVRVIRGTRVDKLPFVKTSARTE